MMGHLTLTHRLHTLMRRGVWSRNSAAIALVVTPAQVSNAFDNLRSRGKIEPVRRVGREVFYRRVKGSTCGPDDRGSTSESRANLALGPGSKPRVKRLATENERRGDRPSTRPYGRGRTALEMHWR